VAVKDEAIVAASRESSRQRSVAARRVPGKIDCGEVTIKEVPRRRLAICSEA
jgi:hypothetical protein